MLGTSKGGKPKTHNSAIRGIAHTLPRHEKGTRRRHIPHIWMTSTYSHVLCGLMQLNHYVNAWYIKCELKIRALSEPNNQYNRNLRTPRIIHSFEPHDHSNCTDRSIWSYTGDVCHASIFDTTVVNHGSSLNLCPRSRPSHTSSCCLEILPMLCKRCSHY